MNRLRSLILTLLTAAATLGLDGCRPVAEEPSPLEPGEEAVVELRVVRGRDDGAMAFVPVYINERGPFLFALDTGASHSVVDAGIADELGLPVVRERVEMTGIASSPTGKQRQVSSWRLGGIELGSHTLMSIEMPGLGDRTGLQGLFGSDVLSRFDRVTVDYSAERLHLRPRR